MADLYGASRLLLLEAMRAAHLPPIHVPERLPARGTAAYRALHDQALSLGICQCAATRAAAHRLLFVLRTVACELDADGDAPMGTPTGTPTG